MNVRSHTFVGLFLLLNPPPAATEQISCAACHILCGPIQIERDRLVCGRLSVHLSEIGNNLTDMEGTLSVCVCLCVLIG